MIISILTLFPEAITPYLSSSILKRAQEKKVITYDVVNIRDFSKDKHKKVDDHPYGGGMGMIMKIDVLTDAIKAQCEKYKKTHSKKRIILLDPRGQTFTQKKARKMMLSSYDHIILICGHYEGVDERIYDYIDETISIGDFVLTGGELPALTIADAITRLIPGVLDKNATEDESFEEKKGEVRLAYPQYTRPETYDGKTVPKILLSGDHEAIRAWRKKTSENITKKHRPDLSRSK